MDPLLQPDHRHLKAACRHAAADYDRQDFFCAEIRTQLLERLDFVSLVPAVAVELGGGTGAAARALQTRYPDALVLNLDSSLPMLMAAEPAGMAVCGDAAKLPLRDDSVDMVISNLMLPSCADPAAVFAEVQRVLRAPGVFLFSTLGPDSLRELRRAWKEVDSWPHVQTFVDMHNVGDALVQAGFREPVMDMTRLSITYTDVKRLARDLRAMAATNIMRGRRRGLTTPGLWNSMQAALLRNRDTTGRFTITAEVVIGQAWTGQADRGVGMTDGIARFPLSRLRP